MCVAFEGPNSISMKTDYYTLSFCCFLRSAGNASFVHELP
jgi:hypothetical protein